MESTRVIDDKCRDVDQSVSMRPFHFGKLSVWVNCDAIAEPACRQAGKEQKDKHFALLSAGCASQQTMIAVMLLAP
jgi:hypothetical protein